MEELMQISVVSTYWLHRKRYMRAYHVFTYFLTDPRGYDCHNYMIVVI